MRGVLTTILLLAAVALITQTSGCSRSSVRQSLHQATRGIEDSPKILADYQPWFGYRGHIDVGYSTQDPAVLRKQIQKAKEMGI